MNNCLDFHIYAGQVVFAEHYDVYNKQWVKHYFVVVYNQALDEKCDNLTDLSGILLTSQKKNKSSFIKLKGNYDFLNKETYANTDAFITFPKRDVIYVCGNLNASDLEEIIVKREERHQEEFYQCFKTLNNSLKFEQLKKEVI